MDEKELKELLSEKLHVELYLFKESMLCKTKMEIYESSYKIEVYVNVYEILMEEVENLDMETVRGVLHWRYGILESLYEEWLGRDDSSFDELKAYVGYHPSDCMEAFSSHYSGVILQPDSMKVI